MPKLRTSSLPYWHFRQKKDPKMQRSRGLRQTFGKTVSLKWDPQSKIPVAKGRNNLNTKVLP